MDDTSIEQLRLLCRVSQSLHALTDLGELLRVVTEKAKELLGAEG